MKNKGFKQLNDKHSVGINFGIYLKNERIKMYLIMNV